MKLQRDRPVRVWGRANPGEVRVKDVVVGVVIACYAYFWNWLEG